MSDTWVGVIGTVAGALVGGAIAAYMAYRAQEREPRLLVLEKRIDAYSELFGRLYSIAECLHQNLPPEEAFKRIDAFRVSVITCLFYMDPGTKGKVLAVYNHLMSCLDRRQIEKETLMSVLNEATRALADGIGIRYT